MRTIRIYQPGPFSCGDEIALSASASHHVKTVLRMQNDEHLTLFCGDNREFSGVITQILKKVVHVKILDMKTVNRESPCSIHLAQGLIKGEKMEWIIQKATELGVASIYPIWTQRSVVKQDKAYLDKKLQQWQAITISACEQSGRNTLPIIHPPLSFENFLHCNLTSARWILDPYATQTCKSHIKPTHEMTLLIGPEGGFHENEIKQALQKQFQPLSLGPRILRAETATISVLSILQALAGDL